MKIMNTTIKLLIAIFFLGAVFVSCQEELTDAADYDIIYDASLAPTVSTDDPAKVSASYSILEGTSQNGDIDKGFFISTSQDFSSYDVVPSDDSSDGVFSARVSELTPKTTYYYKAYASNLQGGTKVGDVKSFVTKEGFDAYEINYATNSVADWVDGGFSTIDKDGDGNDWGLTYYDEEAGQVAFASYSWYGSPLTPENYLLFPELAFDGVDGAITVTVQAADPDWYAEKFKIVVSNAPITIDNCRDAEVILTKELTSGTITAVTADIPASYEGNSIYLAVVHADVTDNYAILFLGAKFSYAK